MNNLTQKEFMYLGLLLAALLLAASITILIYVILRRREKKKSSTTYKTETEAHKVRVKEVRKIIAPDGVNPNPNSYFILNDAGTDVYIRSFTVEMLPKWTVFAVTFPALFNFDRVTASVFIEAVPEGKATSMLDRRVVDIETNMVSAEKNYNRNELRKLHAKLQETEEWARKIETNSNRFYKVYFLFSLREKSLDRLNYLTDTFRNLAKEKGIALSCCYGLQPEVYMSNMPLNYMFRAGIGPVKYHGLKAHDLDKYALSTIFNHTQTDFYHRNGVILGRNMSTWKPVAFDCYDGSHNGYNITFSGMTGTGKSATMKILASRYISKNHYRFACVDSQAKGDRGEYSMLCEMQCGTNFQIKAGTEHVINPFEVAPEEEWNELEGDYQVLRLQDKIEEAMNTLMILIQGNKEKMNFESATYIERILVDVIEELYQDAGIRDNDADSLYEVGQGIVDGVLTSGRVKKKLPTITDLYKKLLLRNKQNRTKEYTSIYRIMLDALRDRVRELYYCPFCLRFYSRQEYEKRLPDHPCSCGKQSITAIKGIKNYYDGQSTITIRSDARFTNIDISQLPQQEKDKARLIALTYIKTQFINKNAVNPKKTQYLAVICDEVHENFGSEPAVRLLDDVSRTSRKRLVSLWTATQALRDYEYSEHTISLMHQAAVKFVFKQNYRDRAWLKEALNLTNGQVEKVLSLGGDPSDKESNARKGEVCIEDNGKICFCKVDYLQAAEAVFVETDPVILQKMYQKQI